MDLRFIELMPAAHLIVNECMKIKPEEKVLLVTDSRISDYFGTESLIQALMASLRLIGNDPSLLCWTTRNMAGMPIPVLAEIAVKEAEALICLNTMHFLQANIGAEALKAGTRMMLLPGGLNVRRTDDKIYRILPRTIDEVREIADLTARVGEKFLGGTHKVHLTSRKGTDLTLEVGPDLLRNVCTGYCEKPGTLSFVPAGQLAIGVTPGTASGSIVIDGSIFPIQRTLSEPLIFTVKDGNFTKLEGGTDAKEFQSIVDACEYPGKYNIAEIGMGMNRKAKMQGESFEDERYYGSAHIGFGSNVAFGGNIFTNGWHCDGLIYDATVEIDGEIIAKDGEFLV
jgi:leucyl aminopeptidase (aminopeptidase T)